MELNFAFFVSISLFIWFETNASIFYLKKILPCYDEYADIILAGGSVKYLDFLHNRDKGFFTQIISCPVCLSVWLSIFLSLFSGFRFYPEINVIGLGTFFLLKILKNLSQKV